MRRCYHKLLGKYKKQNDTSIKTIIPNSGEAAKQLKLKLLEELQNFKVTLENWPFLKHPVWHSNPIPKYLSKCKKTFSHSNLGVNIAASFIISKNLKSNILPTGESKFHPSDGLLLRNKKNEVLTTRLALGSMLNERPAQKAPFIQPSRKENYRGSRHTMASSGGDGSWLQRGTRKFGEAMEVIPWLCWWQIVFDKTQKNYTWKVKKSSLSSLTQKVWNLERKRLKRRRTCPHFTSL